MEPGPIFAPDSFWNAAVASSAPVDTDSADLVARLVAQIRTHYGTVNINTTSDSAPVYVVSSRVRPVRVALRACTGPTVDPAVAAQLARVPVPVGAVPAAGTDHDLIVWQPASDREWEMWRAVDTDGHWSACAGGELAPASTSTGVFPAPAGLSASGLSVLGGLIRLSDLAGGRIDHVLDVAVPDTSAYPALVAPADRTDGDSHAADAIPEGTRFRLAPDVDLASLHLSPVALIVARALQTYGMVVNDTAGAVTFQAQDPTPLVEQGQLDPWSLAFGFAPSYDVLAGIPWGDMEALRPAAA
jgi:hypothetical protein